MERSDECALMHEGIKPELYKGTSKVVSLEFDEYLKPPPAWLAQLVERQSAVREVEGSSPRPDQHSGS